MPGVLENERENASSEWKSRINWNKLYEVNAYTLLRKLFLYMCLQQHNIGEIYGCLMKWVQIPQRQGRSRRDYERLQSKSGCHHRMACMKAAGILTVIIANFLRSVCLSGYVNSLFLFHLQDSLLKRSVWGLFFLPGSTTLSRAELCLIN